MVDLVGLGSLLGGGAQAYGALRGPSKGPDRDYWGRYWREWQRDWSQYNDRLRLSEDALYRQAQIRVADAKAAGLHPLFALGAASGGVSLPGSAGSATMDFTTSDTDTGRWDTLGAGISNVFSGLDRMGRRKKVPVVDRLARRRLNAQVRQDEALAARYETEAYLARQQAMTRGLSVMQTEDPLAIQTTEDGVPYLYRQVYDNLADAYVWLPINELGVELPEIVGAGYWAKGKAYDPDNVQRRTDPAQSVPEVMY